MKINKIFHYILSNIFIIIICIIALLLRVWGTNFSLPLLTHADENVNVVQGIIFVKNNSVNPALTNWGFTRSSFIYEVYGIITFIYLLISKAQHQFINFSSFVDGNIISIAHTGRIFVAVLSSIVVFLTFLISRKIFGRSIGLLSALFLATTFTHILVSHYGTSDVPQGFFQLIAFYFLYQIVKTGKIKYYLFSGLFIGFAVSCNYHAILSAINLVIAHLLYIVKTPFKLRQLKNNFLPLITSLIAVGAGFILLNPYAILELTRFFKDTNYMKNIYRTGQDAIFASSINGLPTYRWWLLYLATSGLGPIYFILLLSGIIVSFFKLDKIKILFISIPLVWFLFMSTNLVRFDRHITPILPIIAIFASIGLNHFLSYLKFKPIIKIALLILVFLPPLAKIIAFDYLIAQKDTRLLAIDWAGKNLDKNRNIFVAGSGIPVGQKLYSTGGFKNVVDVLSNDPKEIFSHPGDILIVGDDSYRLSRLYQNIPPYTTAWDIINTIYQKGKLIKAIDKPLFQREFFGPFFLEHSSTVNIYHNPAILFFEIPKVDR